MGDGGRLSPVITSSLYLNWSLRLLHNQFRFSFDSASRLHSRWDWRTDSCTLDHIEKAEGGEIKNYGHNEGAFGHEVST
jgi:hypothetical protein